MLLIISSILLILAFPFFNLSTLAFIGFVPLFFAIQDKSPKQAFIISYLCGFLFYLGVLYWLYHVTVVGLILLCLYLALYFGIFGLVFNKISVLFSPILWIALEYIQSHLFTGFGWILLGYSQYKNLPLIQIADFSGVYGVSFVIMMVNVSIYRALKKSFREIVIAGVVLIMTIGYGTARINENKPSPQRGEGRVRGSRIKVSVIQGNIPQELKWDPDAASAILKKYSTLTKKAALDNPDLIIWPETSFPGFLVMDKEKTRRLLNLVRDIKIPLLLGANTVEGLKTFNSAVLISAHGEIVDKYDKIHLVPFGEYVPFSDRLSFLHSLVLGELGEFTAGHEFEVFSIEHRAKSIEREFAALICFEDIFPGLARRFVQNGADFLVVITNDAWYGKSGAPYQHAASSVFRAIENRVPVVRCANTGYSCFIDSRGKIYADVQERGTRLFTTGHKTSTLK